MIKAVIDKDNISAVVSGDYSEIMAEMTILSLNVICKLAERSGIPRGKVTASFIRAIHNFSLPKEDNDD